jgi:hypothetical protein
VTANIEEPDEKSAMEMSKAFNKEGWLLWFRIVTQDDGLDLF